MTKIDIFSGFLGAGKTTLIKKLLKEALAGSQVVLIENEFGEIGIDGGFLKESGIEIKEMNSGCICCSLVGDFGTSLKEVMDTYHPERILIEPSGVGKLSDVVKAVQNVDMGSEVTINSAVAVVDASKCRLYIKNFGEFFINQIEHAGTIILSRTDVASETKIQQAVELIREHNSKATIITTPIEQLDGKDILKTIEGGEDLEKELMEAVLKEQESGHHHHHDGECCHGEHEHHDHEHCGHDHEDHEHEEHDHEGHEHCDHDHEDHDHEGHEHEGHDHGHHHDHGEGCSCGCGCGHDHDHHDHHHADEVFTSWGTETPASYTKDEISDILEALEDEKKYGFVLRAKGMVPAGDGTWVYFDYVPGESNVREGKPDVTGKFCVIGSKLNEAALAELFDRK
ncbi:MULTISPECIES: CobW family GTP-binding protein [Eisenbergiella]|uniref:Cobalamin biosynthesis protein CobW n=1 Tax=Eisenbergiella porci TaxID=2652274 RepID=A0A6N7WHF9_9FIRM|nr:MULTISPECIES: CobW family GTP-binding protein [Eisenbergiella]MDY2654347.1 CobW family GTP-binding protein [Eisenbergiella porci]MSS90153.1 cobalamin biosynthesis protein CobW [Eisenbergiella porci]